ncbi:MAG: hypothetical protein M3314_08555 [Actinomycetota bacterium]|nr:hypothetical protein [Actinomycetota bacterium]
MTRSVRMLVLGVLAALALSACGETEGIGTAQRENAERADAICQRTQAEVGTLADDAANDRDEVRRASDEFKAINAPSENEIKWTRFVRETSNLWLSLEDVAQARDPSTNDRPRAERAVTRVRETNTRIMELAEDYGMQVCNRGLGNNP